MARPRPDQLIQLWGKLHRPAGAFSFLPSIIPFGPFSNLNPIRAGWVGGRMKGD